MKGIIGNGFADTLESAKGEYLARATLLRILQDDEEQKLIDFFVAPAQNRSSAVFQQLGGNGERNQDGNQCNRAKQRGYQHTHKSRFRAYDTLYCFRPEYRKQ